MATIPHIQIRQQAAKLGIDAELGKQRLEQPRATMEMETAPAKLEIATRKPDIEIDQSRAWAALGLGGILEAMTRIHEEARNVGLNGIARIVDNGNRLAAIYLKTNAIADIGQEQAFQFYEFDYFPPASAGNVDIHVAAYSPHVEFTRGSLQVRARAGKPVHEYERGKLELYMRQYPKVEIIPPQIDRKL